MADRNYKDRITTKPGDMKVYPPEKPAPESEQKFYMGTADGKAPSHEEALAAGRALFDAITKNRARSARKG